MIEAIQKHKDQQRERFKRKLSEAGVRIRAVRKARWDALTPEQQADKKSAQKTRLQQWRLKNREYHAAYLKEYRKTPEGREVFRRATQKQRANRLRKVQELKAVPCMDCKGTFPPECMDFDHRDPSQKIFSISSFGRRVGWEGLQEEIAKCDVVCANCHRIRTAKRRLTPAPETVTLEA